MKTELCLVNKIGSNDLSKVNAPHFSSHVLAEAVNGSSFPQAHFRPHLLQFLTQHYNASGHQLEEAFSALQQDLASGKVVILSEWPACPAFEKKAVAPETEKSSGWEISSWVFQEHKVWMQALLQGVGR